MMAFCKGTQTYHKPQILRDDSEVLIEICENCKEQQIFKKGKNGGMNIERYREWHKRDMLQLGDKYFNREYKYV